MRREQRGARQREIGLVERVAKRRDEKACSASTSEPCQRSPIGLSLRSTIGSPFATSPLTNSIATHQQHGSRMPDIIPLTCWPSLLVDSCHIHTSIVHNCIMLYIISCAFLFILTALYAGSLISHLFLVFPVGVYHPPVVFDHVGHI